jgi:hypothetical protein
MNLFLPNSPGSSQSYARMNDVLEYMTHELGIYCKMAVLGSLTGYASAPQEMDHR